MGDEEENVKTQKEIKMWQDLTDSEKIERMREEVKRTLDYHSTRLSRIYNELEKLTDHDHLNGEVVMRFRNSYIGNGEVSGGCIKRADGKCYF